MPIDWKLEPTIEDRIDLADQVARHEGRSADGEAAGIEVVAFAPVLDQQHSDRALAAVVTSRATQRRYLFLLGAEGWRRAARSSLEDQIHQYGEAARLTAWALAKLDGDAPTAYEQDVHAWAWQQIGFIHGGAWDGVDRLNTCDELSGSFRRLVRKLERGLRLLALIRYGWGGHGGPGGFTTGDAALKVDSVAELHDLIDDSPSLEVQVRAVLPRAWNEARGQAIESGLPATTLPAECPWTVEQILNDRFNPDPSPSQGRHPS